MAAQMDFGLLWYDNDRTRDLTGKVARAAARYEAKFGRRPNVCYVHSASLERETEWQGVRIVGAPNVLPNHFWIGCASRSAGREAA
ncbi:MAG TPA: hypothetical protein PLJ35_13975 [Anaerolineae bacterium]|nr:hypothetical protein [Anaerolineae bacterium]HOQ99923.1 hypothetical protein [Anaerolineae bacterium]HPL29815.1 hypothetical protein [Anaerolineae bacterium]